MENLHTNFVTEQKQTFGSEDSEPKDIHHSMIISRQHTEMKSSSPEDEEQTITLCQNAETSNIPNLFSESDKDIQLESKIESDPPGDHEIEKVFETDTYLHQNSLHNNTKHGGRMFEDTEIEFEPNTCPTSELHGNVNTCKPSNIDVDTCKTSNVDFDACKASNVDTCKTSHLEKDSYDGSEGSTTSHYENNPCGNDVIENVTQLISRNDISSEFTSVSKEMICLNINVDACKSSNVDTSKSSNIDTCKPSDIEKDNDDESEKSTSSHYENNPCENNTENMTQLMPRNEINSEFTSDSKEIIDLSFNI